MKTKIKSDDCITSLDGQLMVVAAHRYCLERRFYIAGACIDWLTKWWSCFTENTKYIILRDTIRSIQDGTAGAEIDIKGWTVFSKFHFETLSDKSKEYLKEYCDRKEFPF